MYIKEAAAILGVHPQTVRHWVETGRFKALKRIDSGGQRIAPEELEKMQAYMANLRKPKPAKVRAKKDAKPKPEKAKPKKKATLLYADDPEFCCKHPDCIYRHREAYVRHNCDFLAITGISRIKACAPGHEKPADCDQYISGKTKEGKKLLADLKAEQHKRTHRKTENPCFACTAKTPGCNCEKRKIYWADKQKEYQRRITEAQINEFSYDSIQNNLKSEKKSYWEPYQNGED